MTNPYDVSTVVSRSYISEQLQDNMQKGAEQRGAAFLTEFQKESEKKGKQVSEAQKSEKASAADKSVKMEEERKKREKRGKEKEREKRGKGPGSGIDLKA